MIRRFLCRLFGHPPIRFGSIYGACHRCGALIRASQKRDLKLHQRVAAHRDRFEGQ